jgi:hypothetical protein
VVDAVDDEVIVVVCGWIYPKAERIMVYVVDELTW